MEVTIGMNILVVTLVLGYSDSLRFRRHRDLAGLILGFQTLRLLLSAG
jgi:hypothetical protein